MAVWEQLAVVVLILMVVVDAQVVGDLHSEAEVFAQQGEARDSRVAETGKYVAYASGQAEKQVFRAEPEVEIVVVEDGRYGSSCGRIGAGNGEVVVAAAAGVKEGGGYCAMVGVGEHLVVAY